MGILFWAIWALSVSETERKQTSTMFRIKIISFLLIFAPAALQTESWDHKGKLKRDQITFGKVHFK